MSFYVAILMFLAVTFMLQKIIQSMIQNKDTVVVKAEKGSSIVIMKKSDYVTKLYLICI